MSRFNAKKVLEATKEKRRRQLCAAAAAVNGSKEPRVLRHFAAVYGVPKETLRRYCARVPTWHQNRVFTAAQEEEIEALIVKRVQNFLGMTRTDVKEFAFAFAKVYGIKCPPSWMKHEAAGEDWLLGFLERHPSIPARRSESVSVDRRQRLGRHEVPRPRTLRYPFLYSFRPFPSSCHTPSVPVCLRSRSHPSVAYPVALIYLSSHRAPVPAYGIQNRLCERETAPQTPNTIPKVHQLRH
eukprot:GHVU01203106.1.p1 GENE.GHVU01203106.1~~GHVU01203106.1.p1  ORF type:complete len:240 (-),score=22.37 GHVU01203106.1:290-1009(-)